MQNEPFVLKNPRIDRRLGKINSHLKIDGNYQGMSQEKYTANTTMENAAQPY